MSLVLAIFSRRWWSWKTKPRCIACPLPSNHCLFPDLQFLSWLNMLWSLKKNKNQQGWKQGLKYITVAKELRRKAWGSGDDGYSGQAGRLAFFSCVASSSFPCGNIWASHYGPRVDRLCSCPNQSCIPVLGRNLIGSLCVCSIHVEDRCQDCSLFPRGTGTLELPYC